MRVKKPKVKRMSKSEKLIYIIIFLWVVFGILGIYTKSNLAQIAGYYASLTVFIGTYLWGEWKRTSNSTHFLKKGQSSSREIVIHTTVILWAILGLCGILFGADINQLTVYFAALTQFVSSYIIYKTTKGHDLPIFDGKSQDMIDKNIAAADVTNTPVKEEEVVITEGSKEDVKVEPKEGEQNDNENEEF